MTEAIIGLSVIVLACAGAVVTQILRVILRLDTIIDRLNEWHRIDSMLHKIGIDTD